jgi:hypothetical protein
MIIVMERRFNQSELRYIYESAKGRMDCHPDIAEEYKRMIEQHPFYKSETEVMRAAKDLRIKSKSICQVWAKIGRDEEYFYIQDHYIVSDDIRISIAADYIGMAQILYLES